MYPDEYFLQGVLRILRILQNAKRQPVERVSMDLYQPPEGRLIAPFEPAYQFLFIQVRISLDG